MKRGVRKTKIRFVDLFCGIGGFRIAAEKAASLLGVQAKCVFSSNIDENCQKAYEANFHEQPAGDIAKIRLRQSHAGIHIRKQTNLVSNSLGMY